MHIHHKSTNFSNSFKVLLLILITYTSWCNAEIMDEEVKDALRMVEADRLNPVRYCGRRLNHMMKFVCKREVRGMIMNSNGVEKKSLDPTKDSESYNYDEDDMYKGGFRPNDFDDLLPFNDIASARLRARNRNRRGIIDECCRNPCSFINLVKYCPTSG